MDLRAQYGREAALLGGRHVHADLVAYAWHVRRNPWIFGGSRHAEAIAAAKDLLRALLGPPPSRWEVVPGKETPSGKAILRCSACGTETPNPLPCRRRCEDDWPAP